MDLQVDEGGKTNNRLALIQEVQHHPYEDTILHIDFHEVLATEKLRTSVPVRPVGEPAGVKNGGGVLEYVMRELHVECLPQDLPDVIEVNVEKLEIGQSIHVGDITPPAGRGAARRQGADGVPRRRADHGRGIGGDDRSGGRSGRPSRKSLRRRRKKARKAKPPSKAKPAKPARPTPRPRPPAKRKRQSPPPRAGGKATGRRGKAAAKPAKRASQAGGKPEAKK